jgi:hypothetical protein
MATWPKTFHFVADAEGWTATAGNARQVMAWLKPHRSAHLTDPPLADLGGCLRTTAKNNAASAENYWKLQCTWESLGVPAGATVTKVNADYSYRWKQRTKGGTKDVNEATFSNTETGSGPFEFRKADNTLIGTFSTRKFAPDRGPGHYWHAYPLGDPDGSNTFNPGDWSTEYPISETPSSWAIATGTEISVPSAQQPSNTTVQFRLRNLMPLTDEWIVDPGEPDRPPNQWVRLKQDRVVLTITYTPAGGDTNGNAFFTFLPQ